MGGSNRPLLNKRDARTPDEGRAARDVPVRVRQGIVRIDAERTVIRTIVQVAENQNQKNLIMIRQNVLMELVAYG